MALAVKQYVNVRLLTQTESIIKLPLALRHFTRALTIIYTVSYIH